VDLLSKGVPKDIVSTLLGRTSIKTSEKRSAPWLYIGETENLNDRVTTSHEKCDDWNGPLAQVRSSSPISGRSA
jgi:hypothetical protein